MAFQTFDFVWKIYLENNANFTRANISLLNGRVRDWSDVLFGLNQNSRLVQVVGQCSPLTPENGQASTWSNALNVSLNVRWFFYGDYLDINGNVLQGGQVFLSPPNDFKVFPISNPRLYLSSDNPVFEPACIFAGGLRMTEIGVYFPANYAIPNEYWGRLRMQMVFEI